MPFCGCGTREVPTNTVEAPLKLVKVADGHETAQAIDDTKPKQTDEKRIGAAIAHYLYPMK